MLVSISDDLLGSVLRLVGGRNLLVLGHIRLSLSELALELLDVVQLSLIACSVLVSGERETASFCQECRTLLHHLHELQAVLLTMLPRGAILAQERFSDLNQLLDGLKCGVDLLSCLLDESCFSSLLSILLELPKLGRSCVDSLGELKEFLDGWFGGGLTELLDFQIFGGNEGSRSSHSRMDSSGSLVRSSQGGFCLLQGKHLQALQEGKLCVVDLLQSLVNGIHLFLAFSKEGLAHDSLALILGQSHELVDLRDGRLCPLCQLVE
mmetsp:Transcript_1165/g.2590  ORF Transcript_1165/g.2590 Transcript_1165/m.2590 type:complete len:266 (-) Transcript_1165:2554-3351(-)